MRRRWLAGALAGMALVAASCVPPKEPPPLPDPEVAECEQGFAKLDTRPDVVAVASHSCGNFAGLPCPPAPAGGWDGCYSFASNVILATTERPANMVNTYWRTGAHEYGHAWDGQVLTPDQRNGWAFIMGEPFNTEHYAETFSAVVFNVFFGLAPTPDQRAQGCAASVWPCA